MDTLVRFANVKKHFFSKKGKLQVLDDISFDVKENEIVGLVGPSGSGKSTILNLISDLLKPDEGEIERTLEYGYMFQKDNLLPWRSVLKNVLLGLEIKGRVKPQDKSYALELLNKYGLGEFIDSYPSTLSGGMRQRVALIRTLTLKPKLLLLDEPFSALDYIARLNLEEDVYKIIKSEQKSALVVTHDISEAISLSDRIITLSERPTKVLGIHQIDFKGERSPLTTRSKKEFQDYFNTIYKELNNG